MNVRCQSHHNIVLRLETTQECNMVSLSNTLILIDPHGAPFMNMGMMLMNKSFQPYLKGMGPKEWLTQPAFKGFIDGLGAWKWSTDQTLLNCFVNSSRMKVTHLDYKWNGLYTAIPDDKIKDCHFVHFFLKDKLPDRRGKYRGTETNMSNIILQHFDGRVKRT